MFGVTGLELKLCESYLTGRSQWVCVDGQLSDVLLVTVGVPQGSILGPLHFTLYLNDLHNVLKHCDNKMYADHTALSYALKSTTDLKRNINEDFVYLKEYFVISKLSLNIQKCEFLTVGTQQRLTKFKDINIKVDEIYIVKVTTSKYLGFIIDQTLRWWHHIDSMVKKIRSKINVLRWLKCILPANTLTMLYSAIMLPHYDYADSVYDSCTELDNTWL